MALQVFSCPECGAQLKLAPGMTAGMKVKCPRCGLNFAAPNLGAEASSLGVDPPREEPNYSPAPLSPPAEAPRFDEEDYSRYPQPPTPPEARRPYFDFRDEYADHPDRRRGLEGLSSEYTIDLGEWFRLANMHYGAVLGPMIGYGFVMFVIMAIASVIPCVNSLSSLLLNPPLQAGFAVVALAQLKGKNWSFGDFFGGFEFWGNIVINNLLLGLIAAACFIPGLIALFVAAELKDETMLPVAVGIIASSAVGAIYLLLRLSLFSTALIIDRRCSGTEAMQGSWILTRDHFWGLLGVSMLLVLINIGGALLLCVGLLFSGPYTVMVMYSGYRIITAGPQLDRDQRFSDM